MTTAIVLRDPEGYALRMWQERQRIGIPVRCLTEAEWKKAYATRCVRKLTKLAANRGCDLVSGDSKRLLLDLDAYHGNRNGFASWRANYERELGLVREHYGIDCVEWWGSRSGRLHVAITLRETVWDAMGLIALQAALGSDPIREILGIKEATDDSQGEDTRALFRPFNTIPAVDEGWHEPKLVDDLDLPF